MPDTTARPTTTGHVETIASHGLVMLAALNVAGRAATFLPFDPDEAHKLGVAIMCAADYADSDPTPPAPAAPQVRRVVAVRHADGTLEHDPTLT